MLKKALATLGAEVDYFIPERLTDGYGIKDEHVRIPVERGAGLVISVDCGVKSVEFVARPGEGRRCHRYRPSSSGRDPARRRGRAQSGPRGLRLPGRRTGRRRVTFKLVQALLEKAGKPRGCPTT